MIDSLPPKAVIRAAEAERRMIEDDLSNQRILPDREIRSILAFCGFLEAAAGGRPFSFSKVADVPTEEWAFYGKIVQKLVESGELPLAAKNRFEAVFSNPLQGPSDSVV